LEKNGALFYLQRWDGIFFLSPIFAIIYNFSNAAFDPFFKTTGSQETG
jgi:hypothetical protein